MSEAASVPNGGARQPDLIRDRYVAFLDVLGFREVVGRHSFGEFLAGYKTCLQRTLTPHGVNYVVFSDSIVLTTNGAQDEDLHQLVVACSHLFYRLLTLKPWPIAIRGPSRAECAPLMWQVMAR